MQRKDFDLAIKCYEAAVNWQPGQKSLWDHLTTAMHNAGASKEVGKVLDDHHIRIIASLSVLLVQKEGGKSLQKKTCSSQISKSE